MIKILSGWSNPGGSTVAHINLCNLFNDSGLDCTFYGPHDWHLTKCKAARLDPATIKVSKDDILIAHFLDIPKEVPRRQLILSCHETNLFPLQKTDYRKYDLIHYVSDSQRRYHAVDWPHAVISNVLDNLRQAPLNTGAAGIIGSIDPHKQTHLSIQRAREKGYRKIKLFGVATNPKYWSSVIEPMLAEDTLMLGHVDDKQAMYDSVDEVFHSSLRETFNYIKAECQLTGVAYNGLPSAESGAVYLSREEILERWKSVLAL